MARVRLVNRGRRALILDLGGGESRRLWGHLDKLSVRFSSPEARRQWEAEEAFVLDMEEIGELPAPTRRAIADGIRSGRLALERCP